MQPVELHITGDKDFLKTLKKMGDFSRAEMKKFSAEAATMTHQVAVKHIQEDSPSGIVYGRGITAKGRRRKPHQASSEGQYPKSDTGQLVRNITVEKENASTWTVGSRKGAPWGFWLEMKSPQKGGRPWLSRAVDYVINFMLAKYGGMYG